MPPTQGEFAAETPADNGPDVTVVIHEPDVIPPSLTQTLFGPLSNGNDLAIDQVELCGDPAFQRWPINC